MEIITSLTNKTVKKLVRLKQKKYRDELGEFFVEGYKNVLDTCNSLPEYVSAVILSESAFRDKGERFSAYNTVVLADNLFDKVSETQNSQGIMSINRIPKSSFPTSEHCILLDRVRDPGNVGTILRTAAAFGYDVVANDCADIYSPKVVRSAMSAILKCSIAIDISPRELKNAGYSIYAADMDGESLSDFSPPRGKYCVVIGNEANGVGEDVIAISDKIISIPQQNIESLNASVAAGIIMFTMLYGGNN